MDVKPNQFANTSPEGKRNQLNALRPNRKLRGSANSGLTKAELSNRKLFSEFLRDYYHANPRRLKKLVTVCIDYAEAGHARFAELILDRLEGPVKHDPSQQTTYNFNFVSDADRERAKRVVDDILVMDAKTITVPQIPQEIPNGTENERLHTETGGDGPLRQPEGSAAGTEA